MRQSATTAFNVMLLCLAPAAVMYSCELIAAACNASPFVLEVFRSCSSTAAQIAGGFGSIGVMALVLPEFVHKRIGLK